uniref:SCP domain-containing protein n=1 Tax=Meloidogyne javanica TaxID=6303 RepID=A0A915LVN5_MELJA
MIFNLFLVSSTAEAVIGAPLSWWSEKDQCPINASKLHVTPQVFEEAVIGAPLSWWSEKDQCPINASKLHVTPQVFDKCGHMTTVAWSHTTQIGCGIQLCPAQDWCSGWVSILINELKHRTK